MRNKIKNPNVMVTPLFSVRPLVVDNHRATLFVAIMGEISFILVCKTTSPQRLTTTPPLVAMNHHKSTLSQMSSLLLGMPKRLSQFRSLIRVLRVWSLESKMESKRKRESEHEIVARGLHGGCPRQGGELRTRE